MTEIWQVLVEEQRRAAFKSFENELSELGSQYCERCDYHVRIADQDLFAAVVSLKKNFMSLRKADPEVRCKSLRLILEHAYKSDKTVLHECNKACYEAAVTGGSLKILCHKISKIACGLCLICLEDVECETPCTHLTILHQWTENDRLS
jgi:hypothetical protein